jgi:hypothetical protein
VFLFIEFVGDLIEGFLDLIEGFLEWNDDLCKLLFFNSIDFLAKFGGLFYKLDLFLELNLILGDNGITKDIYSSNN